MAFYTEISFNYDVFYNDFRNLVFDAYMNAVEATKQYANQLYASFDASFDIQDLVLEPDESVIAIYTESLRAFVETYGSGKYAETDSPFWEAYTKSDVFNSARSRVNPPVVFYRNGRYKTYDWANDSRTLVEREGSNREGEFKNFPAKRGDPSLMQKILQFYENTFSDEFTNVVIATMNFRMTDEGRYFTLRRVNLS